jgi:hypothetical protein
LNLAVVKRVFAEEGVPLKGPKGRAKRPIVLRPAERAQLSQFAVTVYGEHQAVGDLGLVMVDRGYLVARVRNVLVTFAAHGEVVNSVQAAIERLQAHE